MLTSFIGLKDVRDKLKGFRPPPPRKIGVPIKVNHRVTEDHVSAITTGFDYLVRFELQRQVPHLINGNEMWIAELAPARIKAAKLPEAVVSKITTTLSNARIAWKEYLGNKKPSDTDIKNLATYAVKLAKLDAVIRPGMLPPDFGEVDPEARLNYWSC
jgi:hypothetical protein